MRRGCEGIVLWPPPHITCSGVSAAQGGSVEMIHIYFHRLHIL